MKDFHIDHDQYLAFMNVLSHLQIENRPNVSLIDSDIPEDISMFWLAVTCSCHNLRGVKGKIDGKTLKGTDLYIKLLGKISNLLGRLPLHAGLLELDLDKKIEYLNLSDVELTLVSERQSMIQKSVREYLSYFDFPLSEFDKHCHYKLQGEGGYFNKIKNLSSFSDPQEKKARLLAMTLYTYGIWHFSDIDELKIPVDYHIERLFLRTGVIKPASDRALNAICGSMKECIEEIDHSLRNEISDAVAELSKSIGIPAGDIDYWLWSYTRSNCKEDSINCRLCVFNKICSSSFGDVSSIPKELIYDHQYY